MTEQDVERAPSPQAVDAEIVGKADPRVVSLTAPATAAAEQYRVLALRLEAAARAGTKRIAVTSATVGEGRTLTAANVAVVLGRGRASRVTLVDCDLRSPSVGRVLGLETFSGLVDVVRERARLDETLWRFGDGNLWVLPGGLTPEPHLVLDDRRVGEVLAQIAERSDLVLIDAPPVLPGADLQALARWVDGVVLVIRAGRTRRELVALALDALADTRVLGCVLVGIAEEAGLSYRLCAEHDQRLRLAAPAFRPALAPATVARAHV